MTKPLASVIIVTYNQEEYIEQTIDCALAQKVDFDFEIIIGEDCSTDNTREICMQYEKNYPDKIKVITSDKNIGVVENWHRSVKASNGSYIASCGGDDYWHNNEKLQKQVKFLEDNPEYGMVHSDADMLFEEEGRIIRNFHKSKGRHFDDDSNTINLLLTGKYWIIAGSAIFRKTIFDRYLDLNELKSNEFVMDDIPLWFEIATHSKIHYIDESFITYRKMKGTISSPTSFKKKIALWISCYKCHLHYFHKYNDKVDKSIVSLAHIHATFNKILFRIAFRDNRLGPARKYYNNIVKMAGISHITKKEKFRYYLTYIPYATRLCNLIRQISDNINKKVQGKKYNFQLKD